MEHTVSPDGPVVVERVLGHECPVGVPGGRVEVVPRAKLEVGVHLDDNHQHCQGGGVCVQSESTIRFFD